MHKSLNSKVRQIFKKDTSWLRNNKEAYIALALKPIKITNSGRAGEEKLSEGPGNGPRE